MKKMFNKEKRCYHCDGTLGPMFDFSFGLYINNDKIELNHYYWDEKKQKQVKETLKHAVKINFCPICGTQLVKKIDYNLYD